MTEELYINGRRVDMNADTKITLNFKSNLLGDISKITSSNSQTISLPKTTHNRNIFDDPTSPTRLSRFPRRKHPARYVRNGVTVIKDAYAVMLDCSDKYEIALYWGEMTRFQSWVDSGAKLNDLSIENIYQLWKFENTEPATAWRYSDGSGISFNDNDYLFYAAYDTGVGSYYTMNSAAKAVVAPFPFLSARFLLKKIQSDNGLTFEFPERFWNHQNGELGRTAVHCSTRKSSVPVKASATVTGINQNFGSLDHVYGGLLFTLPASTAYSTENKTFTTNLWGNTTVATHIKFNVEGRAYVSGIFTIGVIVSRFWHNNKPSSLVTPKVYGEGTSEFGAPELRNIRVTASSDSFVAKSGSKYTYSCVCTISGYADVVKGSEIKIAFEMENAEFYKFANWDSAIWQYSSLQVTPPAVEITTSLGEYFRTKGNLPDITQLEFIKAICSMFGLYVIPSGVANKIKFVTLDTLLSNTADAVDWSKKLISNGDGDPAKVRFTWGDYARRNKCTYKADDSVTMNGDGEIIIDNEGLDAEKEIIKLPFSPLGEVVVNPDTSEKGAKIPHLKMGDDNASVVDEKVNPCVVMIMPDDADTGKAIAKFTPVSFKQLIGAYHSTLSNLLNNTIVITEKFRLTEFDLLSLDFTKPVYLRQYGKYYGVVSVQSSGNECTVEMVQLPSNLGGISAGVFYSTDGGTTYSATVPTAFNSVKVVSVGGSIGNREIETLVSNANAGATFDLAEANFEDGESGTSIGYLEPEANNPLFGNASRVILPENVTGISRRCFNGASQLATVTLPPRLKEINYKAFDSSTLRQIDIPRTIEYLEQYAFWSCRRLHTIVCRSFNVPPTNSAVFSNVGNNIIGDKAVFVPNPDAYADDSSWALLARYGFLFRPLSDYKTLDVVEFVAFATSANTIQIVATKPVNSSVAVKLITVLGETQTNHTVVFTKGTSFRSLNVEFDSFTINGVTPKRDTKYRYIAINN